MAPKVGALFLLFFTLISTALLTSSAQVSSLSPKSVQSNELQHSTLQLSGQAWRPLMKTDIRRRRRLGSFQTCALCTCCGGPKRVCVPSPCCYAINCNIPNRPFGVCSFTPKACNCFGCHL